MVLDPLKIKGKFIFFKHHVIHLALRGGALPSAASELHRSCAVSQLEIDVQVLSHLFLCVCFF